MTDPDERTINRAINLLGDEHQDEREAARTALHAIFRNTRRLEAEVERLREEVLVAKSNAKQIAAGTYHDIGGEG